MSFINTLSLAIESAKVFIVLALCLKDLIVTAEAARPETGNGPLRKQVVIAALRRIFASLSIRPEAIQSMEGEIDETIEAVVLKELNALQDSPAA